MTATAVEAIRVVESAITNVVRVEVMPVSANRPLILRVVPSPRARDWVVRDPFGVTICRVATREQGIRVARSRAQRVLEEPADSLPTD